MHLQHLGHPIANDDLYINGPPPFRQPDESARPLAELSTCAGGSDSEGMDSARSATDGNLRPACVGDLEDERMILSVSGRHQQQQKERQQQQQQSTSILEDCAAGGVDPDPMCTQCPRLAAE